MSFWDLAWYIWVAWFPLIEGLALYCDYRDTTKGPKRIRRTLSAHLRRWFNVKTHHGRTVFIVFTGVLFAWLIPHIVG